MLKHDELLDVTAFAAGQMDYIKGLKPDPTRYYMSDAFRMSRYMEGYKQEAEDCDLIASYML